MSSVGVGVQPDACDPVGNQSSILTGRQIRCRVPTPWEEVVPISFGGHLDPVVQRPACVLRDLKLDRPASLLLSYRRPMFDRAIGCYIFDRQSEEIAAAQLAVDCKVEHCEIARTIAELKAGTNGSDVLRLERWLLSNELTLVPRALIVEARLLR